MSAPATANIALLGGSFNPVHVGHLRLAVEAVERLGLDRVDFIPAPSPPHKSAAGMLPFTLRRSILEKVIERAVDAGLPFAVNAVEAQRTGPSFTYDTLAHYREHHPGEALYFLMGGADLLTLSTWRRGQELPDLANLVTTQRGNQGLLNVERFVHQFWPGASAAKVAPPHPASRPSVLAAWRVRDAGRDAGPNAGMVLYVDSPSLEVSASMLRRAWLARRSIAWLAPEPVEQELAAHRDEVTATWRDENV